MAALMRHGVFKTGQLLSPKTITVVRSFATKAEKKRGIDRKVSPKIDSSAQSIAAKGFLRPQKAYTPPSDITTKLENICKTVLGNSKDDTKLTDLNVRFNLFQACSREFSHSIPNSLLCSIETVGDLKQFYETPVNTTTPYDMMKNMDLPENLHVQFEYHRFHPDTDTKFNGRTAFPRSSTLVTGLKYKEKYQGHVQNQTWPFSK